jgi:hypothetical protein
MMESIQVVGLYGWTRKREISRFGGYFIINETFSV